MIKRLDSKHPITKETGYLVRVRRMVKGKRFDESRVVYGNLNMAKVAEREIHGRIESAINGRRVVTNEITLGKLFEAWIEFARISIRSWYSDDYKSKAILEYFGADRVAATITKAEVMGYFHHRRTSNSKRGAPIAPATVDHEIKLLKKVYRFGCENDLVDVNPAQYIRLAKIPNKRERVISDELFTKILTLTPTRHARLIYMTARYTGLRKSHLLALNAEQIKGGFVHPKGFDPVKSLYLSTKGFGLPPMPKSLANLYGVEDGPLFTWKGERIRRFRDATETLQKQHGLDYQLHDLRRTYANHLRLLGVEEYVRMAIMGHSPGSVHARYQAVSKSEILAAGRKIAASPSFKAHLKTLKKLLVI